MRAARVLLARAPGRFAQHTRRASPDESSRLGLGRRVLFARVLLPLQVDGLLERINEVLGRPTARHAMLEEELVS